LTNISWKLTCGLKEDNRHELLLKILENDDEAMKFFRHIQAKSMAIHKSIIGTYVGSREIFVPHRVMLTLESVRTETTTSRGCKSSYVFIEVVLLYLKFTKCGTFKEVRQRKIE